MLIQFLSRFLIVFKWTGKNYHKSSFPSYFGLDIVTFFLLLKPLISFWKSSGLMKLFYIFWSKVCSGPGKERGTRKSINFLFMKERFHSSMNLSMSRSPSMPTFVGCMALLFRASDGEYLGFTLFSMFCLFTVNYFSSRVAWEQEKFSFHYPPL